MVWLIMKYTRIYSDENGESHIEDIEIGFKSVDFAPPAPPLDLSELSAAKKIGFLRAPAGWTGDWHPAPKKQFTIYLAGEIEGETSDGEIRRFKKGDVTLVEDTTGKGHKSRVIGNTDVLLAVVQLE
jgi:hypothetical protein